MRPELFRFALVLGLALLMAASSMSVVAQGQPPANEKQLFEKRCGWVSRARSR